jgi:hypothetical protein
MADLMLDVVLSVNGLGDSSTHKSSRSLGLVRLTMSHGVSAVVWLGLGMMWSGFGVVGWRLGVVQLRTMTFGRVMNNSVHD